MERSVTQPVGAADQGQGPHQVWGFTVTQTQAHPPPSTPLPSREGWVWGSNGWPQRPAVSQPHICPGVIRPETGEKPPRE